MGRTLSKGFGNLLQGPVPDGLHPGSKPLRLSGCEQLQILAGGSHNHRIPHDGITMPLRSIERTRRCIDERSTGLELVKPNDYPSTDTVVELVAMDA